MRIKLRRYSKEIFDLEGDYRPTGCRVIDLKYRIKDFLWRKWMNLFGVTFCTSTGRGGMDHVMFWGDLKDLKVKFIGGSCICSSRRGIQHQEGCLHKGMTYTIEYGDPVRLYNMVYVGRFEPHYDTLASHDYRFRSGNCFVSFAPQVGIRILSIKEKCKCFFCS